MPAAHLTNVPIMSLSIMARQLIEMVNRECSAAAATIALLNDVPANKEIPALKN